ncbi:hypothetical protein BGW39_002934 [Mortierella sp. 14UC]|nr:hypothetical protein BGW39_002934 [Mortierella sp. 14UC]
MLRTITQPGTRTLAGKHVSLTDALRQAPLRTWTSINTTATTTTIAHDHAALAGSRTVSRSFGATSHSLQSLVMASSASRGFFTSAAVIVTKSSTRVAGAAATAVGGRGSAIGHIGRLTFQELQHTRRAFSTSNMLRNNNSNNALTRFAGNFSIDSSNKVVYSIAAINVAVFGVWQYAEGNAKRFNDGRLYLFMFRNFTDSLQNLKEGRVWTLVTSAFSHKEWYHILLNSMVLLSFGDPVWRLLGTRRFLAVYLGSGIAASLSSIFYYATLEPYLRRQQHKPPNKSIHYSMGASGSIMGITTAFACVYPMSQYSLFFVITMPAAALIGLFGAYELYNVLAANTGRFDSAGHLGGGLFGAAYYFTKLRPLIRR